MFKIMFYGGLALAVIGLLFSIFFFVKNDVAKLIGDVTGWNAKKAIRKINKKGTEEVSKTEAIKKGVSKILIRGAETTDGLKTAGIEEALPNKKEEEAEVLFEDEVTTVLNEDEVTEVLGNEDATDVLKDEMASVLADEVTDVLYTEDEPTVLLKEESDSEITMRKAVTDEEKEMPAIFEVEEETTVVHTSESIGILPKDR